MIDGTVFLPICGEELLLHPERAVLWPRLKTVIVADTHFAKTSYFGSHGIAVPTGSDDHDRCRLSRLIAEFGAERLIVLGDFLHAPISVDSREALEIDTWVRELQPAQIMVVAGNHDRGVPRHFSSSIVWREDPWCEPPFRFLHADDETEAAVPQFTLSGHVHPVMRLQGLRKRGLRVPIFWQRSTGLVLPSFGAFTGGCVIRPAPGDHLFAVGPTAVAKMR